MKLRQVYTDMLAYWRPTHPPTDSQRDYMLRELARYDIEDVLSGVDALKATDDGRFPTNAKVIAAVDAVATRRREERQQRQAVETLRGMRSALSSPGDDFGSRCASLFDRLATRSITRQQYLEGMQSLGMPSGEMRRFYEWHGLDLDGLCGSRAPVAEEVGA